MPTNPPEIISHTLDTAYWRTTVRGTYSRAAFDDDRINMSNGSHIHVRALEIGDFAFVQKLASKQPNFTVPPVYILWLMLKIGGSICLIAEHSKDGPLAYLIAVPVEAPERSLFVWQLAATGEARKSKAMFDLLSEFRKIVFRSGFNNILFTTIPDSAIHRLIRQYAWKLGSVVPELLNSLPAVVSSNESEFRLQLTDAFQTATAQLSKKKLT